MTGEYGRSYEEDWVEDRPGSNSSNLEKGELEDEVVVIQEEHVMTVREAGKKGGETVKAKYGPEFYSRIGKKGGDTVYEERGSEFFSEIGKKGGEALKASQAAKNPDFYAEIGRKGGETVKAKHGPEYYSNIGKKGGRSKGQKAKA